VGLAGEHRVGRFPAHRAGRLLPALSPLHLRNIRNIRNIAGQRGVIPFRTRIVFRNSPSVFRNACAVRNGIRCP
jgi:hypothetical protein